MKYEKFLQKVRLRDPWKGEFFFWLKDSAGMLHLKRLSTAGVTHVHLLPTFQFAEVQDEKHKWKNVGKS